MTVDIKPSIIPPKKRTEPIQVTADDIIKILCLYKIHPNSIKNFPRVNLMLGLKKLYLSFDVIEIGTALYAFAAEQEGDLTFEAGDEIKILKKRRAVEEGWWRGELANGDRGLVPSNFITLNKNEKNNNTDSLYVLNSDELLHLCTILGHVPSTEENLACQAISH